MQQNWQAFSDNPFQSRWNLPAFYASRIPLRPRRETSLRKRRGVRNFSARGPATGRGGGEKPPKLIRDWGLVFLVKDFSTKRGRCRTWPKHPENRPFPSSQTKQPGFCPLVRSALMGRLCGIG